ncbi:Mrx11p NDAI_0E03090 [Naumovozyma dairenensis CBS 421]|uniref:Uncharacterized protein n=1 Tax=Naumovozyma dairenensis (strain ATCC 10597 / BCRC 20456 / CBS 421 / NBRC 0211 / NRRL Y-12639) TaxID=1071378 RepID=G0WBK6_NAUDC|nr:hypothetical protein NDAI_0E03090 [Naumovozyma dairenensis CBS 421]CCD25126.1 hypothetical protein NDAI_0E03090 [Naumovozyma dairenensis CBS 421]
MSARFYSKNMMLSVSEGLGQYNKHNFFIKDLGLFIKCDLLYITNRSRFCSTMFQNLLRTNVKGSLCNFQVPSRLLVTSFRQQQPNTNGITFRLCYSTKPEITKDQRRKDEYNDKLHKMIKKSKVLTRLNDNPKFSHYFNRLSETGTIPTVTSFLLLHELTAIAPLLLLWWIFYNLDFEGESTSFELPDYIHDLLERCNKAIDKLVGDKYDGKFDRKKLVLTGAISYTIVKLLYPARILLSLWGAPYFGRWMMIPFQRLKMYLKK